MEVRSISEGLDIVATLLMGINVPVEYTKQISFPLFTAVESLYKLKAAILAAEQEATQDGNVQDDHAPAAD